LLQNSDSNTIKGVLMSISMLMSIVHLHSAVMQHLYCAECAE